MGSLRRFSPHVKWTEEEIERLQISYICSSREELRLLFAPRSIESIEAKANAIGLSKQKRQGRTVEEVRRSKRESMAKKRAGNPEAMREYQAENYRLNREKRINSMKQYQHRRFFWLRATKLKSNVNSTDLARLWKLQRGRCALTGRRLNRSNAHLDHILAKSKGGSDEISNLRWLCKEANLALRELSDEEFMRLCSDVMRWIGRRILLASR